MTTVPAEPSLHNFFGANGFRECFTLFQEDLDPGELPAPAWDNPLRPVSPAEYGAVREKILADCPHIAYPEEALALSGRMLRPVRRRPVCRGDGGRPCLRLRRRGRGGSGGV